MNPIWLANANYVGFCCLLHRVFVCRMLRCRKNIIFKDLEDGMSKQKVKEDFIVTAFFENMDGGVPNIYMGNDFHDASVESYIYFSRKMNCAPKEYDNYFRKMDDF